MCCGTKVQGGALPNKVPNQRIEKPPQGEKPITIERKTGQKSEEKQVLLERKCSILCFDSNDVYEKIIIALVAICQQ